MAVEPVEQKLAAIFAAEIAGYSRPKGRDEALTLSRFKACRIIIGGLIAPHRRPFSVGARLQAPTPRIFGHPGVGSS